MSRISFNTNDSTYVDDTSYDIDSNVQLDHESLERHYSDINPNLDEYSGEEVEVDPGEEDLEDTPTSPVAEVSTETTNSTEQDGGQGGTGGLNRHLLFCVPIEYKEAKALADRKKGISVNDFDINVNE
ncbi:hypothetical protein H5410_028679 [Solanum commersonii]|uniref:Uncharacterized protein n=1 Tax=Solanum commersonii TaxID=4109 RepID=A0A9J5Z2L7_SOLCO|nr:hypothetical protein H5410_028679 [Solanum commersonii]